MFGIPQPYPIIFGVLLVCWLAAFIIGMATGTYNEERTRRLSSFGRFGMVILTLVIGLLCWLGIARSTFALLVFLGLVAGAAGDVILGNVLPLKKPVPVGILAFSVGHGFYMAAIFVLRGMLGIDNALALIVAVSIVVVIAVVLWFLMVRNPEVGPVLNIGSLVYAALLFAVTGMAADVAIQSGKMVILFIGLLLFAISDIMLSQPLIKKRGFTSIRDVSFIIYSAGQVLIALAIAVSASL